MLKTIQIKFWPKFLLKFFFFKYFQFLKKNWIQKWINNWFKLKVLVLNIGFCHWNYYWTRWYWIPVNSTLYFIPYLFQKLKIVEKAINLREKQNVSQIQNIFHRKSIKKQLSNEFLLSITTSSDLWIFSKKHIFWAHFSALLINQTLN